MNIENLLVQSLQLLVLGMGTVFVILSLLIGIIQLLSRLLPPEAPATSGQRPAGSDQAPAEELIAVIQAAIHRHLKKN